MGQTFFGDKLNKDRSKSLTKHSLDKGTKMLVTVGAIDEVEPVAKV